MEQTDGFRVQIKDINSLFEYFSCYREIEGYMMGNLVLENKLIDYISIRCTRLKNRFSVVAIIEAASTERNFFHYRNLKIPFDYLEESKKYQLRRDPRNKRKLYTLDSQGKNKDMFIHLFDGDVHVGFGYELTRPKVIGSIENFQGIMERLAELTQTVVAGICNVFSMPEPKETLMFLPEEEMYADEINGAQRAGSANNQHNKPALITSEKSNFSFDMIGGQAKAKGEVVSIAQALQHPEEYKTWGVRPTKGMLLWGPTGTGKTLMAKALANSVDANFFNIKLSEILTMWYGESSNNIQRVFDSAKAEFEKTKKMSILFFDEIDALVGGRGDAHEESQRVVQVILTNLDGLESNEGLAVIAATNRKDAIDKAFLRPGRIDKLIEVPLPDAVGRKAIFNIHMDKSEKIANNILFERDIFDWLQITSLTEGMNGAEIAEIVRRSLEEKAKEEITKLKKPDIVSQIDLMRHIKNYERRDIVKKIGFSLS